MLYTRTVSKSRPAATPTSTGRFASPEDKRRPSPSDPELSGYVNGHTLSVDGGWFGDGSWESLRRGKQDFDY